MKTKAVAMRPATVPASIGTNSYVIGMVIVAMMISAVSAYAVIILLFGMLPGLIAMIIDQESRKYVSNIVIAMNGAGVAPYVIRVLKTASTSSNVAIEIITDPKTWLTIYLAAAVGWIIYWIFPQVAILINSVRMQLRIAYLTAEIEQLVQEWGDEIKSSSK